MSGSRNPNCTILGVEREFAPIERPEDTAKGHLVVAPSEKHALDCLILIAKKKRRKNGPQSFEYSARGRLFSPVVMRMIAIANDSVQ
jgi:hypothetical protein